MTGLPQALTVKLEDRNSNLKAQKYPVPLGISGAGSLRVWECILLLAINAPFPLKPCSSEGHLHEDLMDSTKTSAKGNCLQTLLHSQYTSGCHLSPADNTGNREL